MPQTDRPEKLSFSPEDYPVIRFPDMLWQRFCEACVSLAIPSPESYRDLLERIYSHLIGVNEWMNLTRLTAPDEFLWLHILDSLTAYEAIEGLTEPGQLCVDFGSGGGYPGLPLMSWLPDRKWRLIDSRKKKASFLAEAVKLTPCHDAAAIAVRGSEISSCAPTMANAADLVVARAVGQADKILCETVQLLRMNGFLLLMKGPSFAAEERRNLQKAAPLLGFEIIQEQTISLIEDDPERLLVLLAKTDVPSPIGKRRRRRRH